MLSAAGPSKKQRVLKYTSRNDYHPETYSTNSRSCSGGTRPSKSSWSGPEYTEVVNVSFDATLDISRMCNIDIVNLKNTYAVKSQLMFGW